MENNKDALLLSYLENKAKIFNKDSMKRVNTIDSNGSSDQEIYYILKENAIETISRGRISESYSLPPNVIWPVFCVFLKRRCCYHLNTTVSNLFDVIGDDQKRFVALMKKHADSKYYSISELRQGCINIEAGTESSTFSVFYIYENGDRFYIQKNDKTPFCFGVFYNFTSSLQWISKAIEEYERVFHEKLSDECKKIIIDISVLYRGDKYKPKQKDAEEPERMK